jgi:hypothetical protein
MPPALRGIAVSAASAHPDDLGWLQRGARAVAPRDQWAEIGRFFDGLVAGIGLVGLDATSPAAANLQRGVGVLIPDDDPVFGSYFGLRERLDDTRFEAVWCMGRELRWSVLCIPTRPPLLRLTVDVTVRLVENGDRRRLVRNFLFFPDQLGPDLLLRFSEPGGGLWLMPVSTAMREQQRGGAGSMYDTLSRCLPMGQASGAPIPCITQALDWLRTWEGK